MPVLPTSICTCQHLEELNISHNPLRGGQLPGWLDELSSLKVLIADNVGLSVLPFALSALVKLETLSVRNNKLSQLPSWLHLVENLQRLCIDGNPWYAPWLTVVSPLLSVSAEASSDSLQARSRTLSSLASSASLPSLAGQPSQNSEFSTPRNSALPKGLKQMRSVSDFGKSFSPRHSPDTEKKPLPAVSSATDKPLPPINDSSFTSSSSSSDDLSMDKTVREGSSRLKRSGTEHASGGSKWAFSLRRKNKKDLGRLNIITDMSAQPGYPSDGAPPLSAQSSGLPSATGSSVPSTATVSEFGVAEAPMSPLVTQMPSTQSLPLIERRRRNRLSYLPVGGASTQPDAQQQADWDLRETEMHLKRVKALMQYLRDLDDLCAEHQQYQQQLKQSESSTSLHQLSLQRMQSSGALSTSALSTRSSDAGILNKPTPSSSRRPSEATSFSVGHSFVSASTNGFTTPEEGPAPPVPALPAIAKSKDDAPRRCKIVAEIVSSEESYVRGLQELVDVYVKPAQQPFDKSSPTSACIPPSEQRAVFGNVEALLHFHQGAFLPLLKQAAAPVLASPDSLPSDAAARVAEEVSSVFVRHSAFFRMYSTYINNCEAAQARVTTWLAPAPSGTTSAFRLGGSQAADGELTSSQRKIIKKFLKRCRADPRHSQISIESYLLLPVQRIPRYRLLLEDLVRSTPSQLLKNPDSVHTALMQISEVATSVNESKRQAEQDKRLWEWQDRITGHWPSPLVQPHRKLLKDGPLLIRRVVKRSASYVQSEQPGANPGDTPITGVLAIDVLQQQAMNKPVMLLLCNDIAVVLSTPTPTKADKGADKGLFELYAVLRIRQQKGCEIVGETSELTRARLLPSDL